MIFARKIYMPISISHGTGSGHSCEKLNQAWGGGMQDFRTPPRKANHETFFSQNPKRQTEKLKTKYKPS